MIVRSSYKIIFEYLHIGEAASGLKNIRFDFILTAIKGRRHLNKKQKKVLIRIIVAFVLNYSFKNTAC